MKPGLRVRTATSADIPAMHRIRLAVRENQLGDSTGINEGSYTRFVNDGAAWMAQNGSEIFGFAALDTGNGSVWALFVDPESEGLGAGQVLHDCMLESARQRGLQSLFLTTTAETRAERFYRQQGWQDAGRDADGELRFERQL